MLSPANVVSVVAGVVVFVVGIGAWNTNAGVFAAAIVGAVVTGVVWLIWWTVSGPPDMDRLLGTPRLGTIPADDDSPAPTLTDTSSASSKAYRQLLHEIEGHTKGQVLLVSSPAPGQGATTVAVNLAVSGTQRGRRIALIDGDVDGDGVSRFLSTGIEPGLTDLAEGDSTLADASRLWTIGTDSALPVVPSGLSTVASEAVLAGAGLAASIDQIAERADAVFIDAPPIAWDGATAPLAAHADGTILVVTDAATESSVADARDRLAEAGAPVIGYVANRSKPPSFWRIPYVRMLSRIAVTFFAIAVIYSAFTGFKIYESWASVDRETLATAAAGEALPSTSIPPYPMSLPTMIQKSSRSKRWSSLPRRSRAHIDRCCSSATTRSRHSPTLSSSQSSRPTRTSPHSWCPSHVICTFPNRCTNGYGRINTAYRECGDVNAPTMLALAVEDFTGIKVDNFAIFDFAGFEEVINGVGGVEICSEYPLRDAKSYLDFPGGCVNADGATALAWVRSRKTQQLVDGSWRSVPGASDLLRNEHQQDVLIQLASKLRTFESPTDLSNKIDELSERVRGGRRSRVWRHAVTGMGPAATSTSLPSSVSSFR